jgi:hypothetical protein
VGNHQGAEIVSLTEQGLKEGGLGIGVVPGYAPGSGYKELLAIHSLAAKYAVPTYSHVRSEGDVKPMLERGGPDDGLTRHTNAGV